MKTTITAADIESARETTTNREFEAFLNRAIDAEMGNVCPDADILETLYAKRAVVANLIDLGR